MPPTLTPKLGLSKPDPDDNYDVLIPNGNMDILDNSFGVTICTSTTRPSTNLFNGREIFETDTGLGLVYNAGGWRFKTAYILPVASAAARNALTPVWEGMQIYRTDKDWIETYDGTNWKTPSGLVVSALADITSPNSGQLAILNTDWIEYRWGGSNWQQIRLTVPSPNITRRLNASTATGAATNFKIPFDTAVTGPVDMSYASGNFTFTREGIYLFSSSVRRAANSEFYLWFAKSADSSGNRGKNSAPTGGGLNKGAAAEVRVAAGESWSVWCWSSPSVNLARESGTTDDYAPYFSARYLCPL